MNPVDAYALPGCRPGMRNPKVCIYCGACHEDDAVIAVRLGGLWCCVCPACATARRLSEGDEYECG